jgi:hypothetical protein
MESLPTIGSVGVRAGGKMDDTVSFSDRMQKLQQMRVALVLLLSEETSKLLSQRQRASGKEIEVMCAERDSETDQAAANALEQLYFEDRMAKESLAKTEDEITRMEDVLAKIDADIGAMCQS